MSPLFRTSSLRVMATLARLTLGLAFGGLMACSPRSLVDVQSPSTVVDPSQVENATGAAELHAAAYDAILRAAAGGTTTSVIGMSGAITDELQDLGFVGQSGDDRNTLTTVLTKNQGGYGYDQIQLTRVQVRQALQALQQYGTGSAGIPKVWQGELYAYEGYTIVWLAELFCSGIPLSESSLTGAQIPTRGFTTEELLTRAIALFDSAMTVGADSSAYVNLARVGKARALLALGQLSTADTVVASVPLDFVYQLVPAVSGGQGFDMAMYAEPGGYYRVQDREGGNGLVWSTDPRVAVVTVDSLTGPMLWPAKYNVDEGSGLPAPLASRSDVVFHLADGLEAALIRAEAALAAGDGSWLTTLNTLRSTCVGGAACAPRPGLSAGELPPLTDPGTPAARLDTLMKERAMWLYLTGHREGDLRRMAHVYSRDPNTLWPVGTIQQPAYAPKFKKAGPWNGLPYGSDVVYGPDMNEHIRNPSYAGCSDTNP